MWDGGGPESYKTFCEGVSEKGPEETEEEEGLVVAQHVLTAAWFDKESTSHCLDRRNTFFLLTVRKKGSTLQRIGERVWGEREASISERKG